MLPQTLEILVQLQMKEDDRNRGKFLLFYCVFKQTIHHAYYSLLLNI